jgi:hypothetical protein
MRAAEDFVRRESVIGFRGDESRWRIDRETTRPSGCEPDGQIAATNRKGSSGRTRTYNPPVNRPLNELLPRFAGLCFKLLPCAFAQEMNPLSSCFYLP